ncbi:class I SAM-dependent DNA methyltransferase [Janibacter cremeus]|uniref:Ubiquinone/menaquinone biosynthesis C-methylase UbiE n=1 Tax=Janibacter cremeus TaxID=1285192 RepID=A0A852VQ84_9MICO|nr:class I SAM-dependent methyltransferase [Janibacter cremeus]NYF98356.1 ubiquinone/menaquinone biosynthesis C-methylase UbiE [Janibacter cremeus]
MSTHSFDDKAATWDDDPDKARQSGEVARGIAAAVPLAPRSRVLEYGAGTGLVMIALLDDLVEPILTLADNSSGMRQVLADKVEAGVLPSPTRVSDLDLETHPVPTDRYDLVLSSMVMHHVKSLDVVLAAFFEVLGPGGHLCIADLDKEDGSFHQHDFDGHHGFDRTSLQASLERAGFTDVTVSDCSSITRDDATYPVFLAVARKP